MICVYKAIFENGKVYIGITNNFNRRKSCHKYDAKNGKKTRFYIAIRKYGFDTLKWEVLSYHKTYEEAGLEETRLISESNPNNYNLASGGSVPEWNEETKQKLREHRIGKRASEEFKAQQREYKRKLYEEKNGKPKNPHRDRCAEFIKKFEAGELLENTLSNLYLLAEHYNPEMSLYQLSEITKIGHSTITLYQWCWLRLNEYIPQDRKNKNGYKMIKHKDKDIRWKQKRSHKTRKMNRIIELSKLDTKGKTLEEISKETGVVKDSLQRLHRAWEDIILEEGF